MRIGDFCKTNLCTYSEKEKWSEIHYLDTGNITRGKIAEIQTLVPGVDTVPSRARRKVQINDIIYSTVRPNQRHYGIIRSHDPNMLVSTGFVVITVDPQVADPDFIYYYLTQDDVVETLETIGEQSTSAYPSIKPVDIENLEIALPPLEVQNAVGALLRQLDKKCALNDEINDNLAQQAQAILTRFMETYAFELRPLSEIADVIDCLHSKKPDKVDDSVYQLIQLDNIRDDGFLDLAACRYMISKCDYDNWTRKCEIIEGDCVITNVGRIGAVSQAPFGTHAAMGRNMTCIRLKNECDLRYYFITVLLSQHMRMQIRSNTDEGTIMGALNVKNIPKLLFPIFNAQTMHELEETLSPIRKQIEYLNLMNQNLAAIRDALLPKLISGAIDVSAISI